MCEDAWVEVNVTAGGTVPEQGMDSRCYYSPAIADLLTPSGSMGERGRESGGIKVDIVVGGTVPK